MASFGSSFGVERGFVARPPATANLMIDSADRPNPTTTTPFDFQITRQQSILNGFFTRIATTEVVLEWCETNVDGAITMDVSGSSSRQNVNFNFVGNFTMEDLMNAFLTEYNTLPTGSSTNLRPVGTTLNLIYSDGYWGFDMSGGQFQFISTPLGNKAGLQIGGGLSVRQPINGCVDLRRYRYIDIVSSPLTYPQSLKDASTQLVNRDVLCRWYMAEDTQENLDGLGFPILMGYQPFVRRRLFNPPKYIKWDNNLPVGNLSFQVYDENGNLLIPSNGVNNETEWLMTLQVSEN